MRGLDVFRWLMPASLAVFLSVPVQTVNAMGPGANMGGMGGGHMGAMGGRGRSMMGGRPMMGQRMMGSRFVKGNAMRSSAQRRDPTFSNRNFAQHRDPTFSNRFVNRGDRFFDHSDFRRFEREEREEHEFFFRHNFFVAFNFGAFGFWPWWWWGWPGWWPGWWDGGPGWWSGGWDGGYPYYDSYRGYYSSSNDRPANRSRSGATKDSQYGAAYWNNLATSVQTKLADQGYYHSQIDGVIGSGTVEAVRRFQTDHGLNVTGKIDPELLNALGINYKSANPDSEPQKNN